MDRDVDDATRDDRAPDTATPVAEATDGAYPGAGPSQGDDPRPPGAGLHTAPDAGLTGGFADDSRSMLPWLAGIIGLIVLVIAIATLAA